MSALKMAQETRKDPRAKVLTVTVRYKSATLDEFIEHHSHDVSRGGMFIKTVSPFPAGTLLKIEVRIAGDQRVMQGVGRVVWKRESGEASDGAPAGMGVKFIKIDDASRGVIDQLVAKSGGAVSAFERGGGESPAPDAPADAPAAAKPVRKQTMIGLGSLGADAAAKTEEPKPDKPSPAPGFFPETSTPSDLPPPEDRTVMKQAAELLQDALREAGGSMDEVGTPAAASSSSVPPPRPIASDAPTEIRTLPSDFMAEHGEQSGKPASERDADTEKPAAAKANEKAGASLGVAKAGPAAGRPAASRSASASSPRAPANRPSTRPPAPTTRRVSVSAEETRTPEGASGGKMAVIALAIAAVGGGLFMLTKSPATPPEPPAAAPTPPEPAPVATTAAPAETAAPTASTSAAPAESALPATPLSALPPLPSTAPATSAELTPSIAKPKPAPVVARPLPKPPAPKPPAEPTTASTPPASEPTPAEPKPPVEPKAPAEAKPPASPKPPAAETKPVEPKAPTEPKAPVAPKPPTDSGDNPY
jgi:uncharacterized protein (TIGR02266 family)